MTMKLPGNGSWNNHMALAHFLPNRRSVVKNDNERASLKLHLIHCGIHELLKTHSLCKDLTGWGGDVIAVKKSDEQILLDLIPSSSPIPVKPVHRLETFPYYTSFAGFGLYR